MTSIRLSAPVAILQYFRNLCAHARGGIRHGHCKEQSSWEKLHDGDQPAPAMAWEPVRTMTPSSVLRIQLAAVLRVPIIWDPILQTDTRLRRNVRVPTRHADLLVSSSLPSVFLLTILFGWHFLFTFDHIRPIISLEETNS